MTARILVVDDIEANVKLLEAKLSAEYFEVLTATDGATGLAIAASAKPDIILLDIMMPGMDGFEVCRRLKDDPLTRHIPVVLVTALDGRADRIAGLEAGADEFLTKPIDDVVLLARVKSLTRLKLVIDELREREASGRRMGVIGGVASRLGGVGGRVIIVDDNDRQATRIMAELAVDHRPVVESNLEKAALAARGPADLVIVNIATRGFDGLRFAAAPAITPMRRPEASRSRSSSITSFRRVRDFTRANSTTSSIGLVRNSSAPASRPAIRSERPSSAVTSTTGIWRVAGSSFSRRHTWNPSMPGIITSSRMMSGFSAAAMARAVTPSVALITS